MIMLYEGCLLVLNEYDIEKLRKNRIKYLMLLLMSLTNEYTALPWK